MVDEDEVVTGMDVVDSGVIAADIAGEEREENDSAGVKPRAARIESNWAETSAATSFECGVEDDFCPVEGCRCTICR